MAVTTATSATRPLPKYKASRFAFLERESVLGSLFVAPALLIILIFIAYPFFYGLWLSVTDTTIMKQGSFVGFRNFSKLLDDPGFLLTVRNSFEYTGVTTFFKFTFGMAIAVLLNQKFRFQRLARAAILLPWIIPTVLSTIAWRWMYDAQFSVFNWFLDQISIQGPIWLGDGHWPMISLMIVNIWRGTPFYAISFLAGMQTIDPTYYEAAQIDGAGWWRQFRNVTLPLLQPVILVVLLLSIILTFADFQITWVLTQGGPIGKTHLFATLAYQTGMTGTKIGEGAAISLFLFPALCALVFFIIRTLRQED